MDKLTSRKFWLCVAAFLASVATSIAGIHTDNEIVTIVGVVSGVLSAAIYSAAEAVIDAKAVGLNELDIVKMIEQYIEEKKDE